MDKVYEQMRLFSKELISFNMNLKNSMKRLEIHHNEIVKVWNPKTDNFRREYDKQWKPLDETMKDYINREAPAYVEFLQIKLRALRKYLGN